MKTRILFIDDEAPAFARLLPKLMREYDLRLESDATKAIDVAREFLPDVLLLDLIMPAMDGLELAAKFHQQPQFSHTPVILISACVQVGEDGEPVVFSKFPAFGKPFSIPCLKRCIERELAAPREG